MAEGHWDFVFPSAKPGGHAERCPPALTTYPLLSTKRPLLQNPRGLFYNQGGYFIFASLIFYSRLFYIFLQTKKTMITDQSSYYDFDIKDGKVLYRFKGSDNWREADNPQLYKNLLKVAKDLPEYKDDPKIQADYAYWYPTVPPVMELLEKPLPKDTLENPWPDQDSIKKNKYNAVIRKAREEAKKRNNPDLVGQVIEQSL